MKIPVRIAAIEQISPTTKSFVLDLQGQPFEFQTGQWVDCYAELDGSQEVAGYSMTSTPLTTASISLAVKLVGDNPVTDYLHERAKVGDMLYIEGGQGDVYYRREMGDSLVLIGGGIGITPLMSIVGYVDKAAPDVHVTLLYSAGSPSELLFRDRLTAIADRNPRIRRVFTVTRPTGEAWDGRTGRIDARMIADAGIDMGALFYVCGPPPMIDDAVGVLQGLGVVAARIMYEQW